MMTRSSGSSASRRRSRICGRDDRRRRRHRRAGARSHASRPRLGPAPALNLPPIQKRQLVERAAGVDRRAARGAARAGQPVVLQRQRRRSRRQVRRRQPDRGDARRRRRLALVARARRRDRFPRRRPRDDQRRSTRRPCGCTCRSRGSPTRCRSWPTWRCGRPFPRRELDRLRQQRLTGLLQARDDPATMRPLAFARVLYGADASLRHGGHRHRRRRSRRSPPTICGPSTRAHFRPDNATLLVVGDVTPDTVLPLLEKQLRRVEGRGHGAAPRRRCRPRRSRAGAQVYIVDKPGAAQSQIRIGWVGVPRSTPDYFPIQVLNTILGGSFTLAAEPEPAREARLHLRRELGVRHARCRPGRSSPRPACRPTRPPKR